MQQNSLRNAIIELLPKDKKKQLIKRINIDKISCAKFITPSNPAKVQSKPKEIKNSNFSEFDEPISMREQNENDELLLKISAPQPMEFRAFNNNNLRTNLSKNDIGIGDSPIFPQFTINNLEPFSILFTKTSSNIKTQTRVKKRALTNFSNYTRNYHTKSVTNSMQCSPKSRFLNSRINSDIKNNFSKSFISKSKYFSINSSPQEKEELNLERNKNATHRYFAAVLNKEIEQLKFQKENLIKELNSSAIDGKKVFFKISILKKDLEIIDKFSAEIQKNHSQISQNDQILIKISTEIESRKLQISENKQTCIEYEEILGHILNNPEFAPLIEKHFQN